VALITLEAISDTPEEVAAEGESTLLTVLSFNSKTSPKLEGSTIVGSSVAITAIPVPIEDNKAIKIKYIITRISFRPFYSYPSKQHC
jgi:hypothetical protein